MNNCNGTTHISRDSIKVLGRQTELSQTTVTSDFKILHSILDKLGKVSGYYYDSRGAIARLVLERSLRFFINKTLYRKEVCYFSRV